ncbi:protein kinase, partial [Streptomyces sp. SID10853]|uniref:serine/threonine-protein kinase n=1 Tax=Streptomyces sp. SID10853 TaxID=2706028 RepID=UPI0031BAAB30
MAAGDGNGGELVGRVLGGRYRVTAPIGRGGMGVVARAVDQLLNREVAVKILRAYTDASGAELADLRARMHREAQAAARIRHPSVVTVHDVTEEQGLPVIVMELVDGPSLDDVLTERGTVEPREAAEIGARLMDALDAAHRVGVLHRDVKPGNVLLERGGRVVLTDFGIASMEASGAPGEDARERLTRSGELVGSLDYLPPERARGMEPGPASDIWALGMTLYAAVEGASPFRRTSAWSTLAAIVTEPLPEPRLAGPLTPVLRALMAKEPADRPTADQARRMLEAVAAGGTSPAAPGNTPGPGQGRAAPPKAYPPLSFGPAPQDSPSDGPEQPSGDTPLPYGPRQQPVGDTPPLYGPRQPPGGDTSLPYGSQQPPGGDTPPPYGSYGPAPAPPAPAAPRFPQPDQQSGGEFRTGGEIRTHDAATAGGHRTAPARARRRSRTVIAAAAAVVLVGGGTAYAVLAHQGGGDNETRASHSTAPVSPGNTLPSAD